MNNLHLGKINVATLVFELLNFVLLMFFCLFNYFTPYSTPFTALYLKQCAQGPKTIKTSLQMNFFLIWPCPWVQDIDIDL